ncbi:MAG: DEAD/DEAH box helicase [Deltaproteobacteria bacterium]|jgi:DNA excision repair protein ERCC-3|nr:DEAD/DEAH box helicase [Deltaproteobacteria bacterium]MBK9365829.1 DEAD/DEAH box helicase [Deltaproteobacteria bacterium]MBK9647968.1 DEAD/DEAH box helicase [Deltaproteobacteria bacterium]
MNVRPENPVIVQGDGKVLVETSHRRHAEARDFLSRFAELEQSPEHLHTYRISPLSLWNAAAAGVSQTELVKGLKDLSKFDIPKNVLDSIHETMERYGLVKLIPHPDRKDLLRLEFATAYIAKVVSALPAAKEMMVADGRRWWGIQAGHRGLFKQRMLTSGWPIEDLAGFSPGAHLEIKLRQTTKLAQKPFIVRDYQTEAAKRWFMDGKPAGGHGVVVLPCGAGKTIVALKTMSLVNTHTLILATNAAAVDQWVREILDKTHLTPDQVGAYMGERKEIRPVTVATYQILTWRRNKGDEFEHLHLFSDRDWGLIIYDEVHLLPAPVFGATADLQGRRRMGLTATLVREDGREGDVFSLVGPKRYDLPWQLLEKQGFIAEAKCYEVRVPFAHGLLDRYERSDEAGKFKIASVNPAKMTVMRRLIDKHKDDNVLVIGTYIDQLEDIAATFRAPLITGKTPHARREELFDKFRKGQIKLLIVSKVANFSIDLPDANVAIQVSGTFGSRQEEAQRLGRILRPSAKSDGAFFYTVVTRDTKEQEFAMKRQLFLTEQGYRYFIQEQAAT